MAAAGLEIVGITLAVLGWLLTIVCCVLPMWRVTAFIGTNIITAQVYWEGIWMSCVVQSTGQMQCKVYDSLLALPQDLQAARALTVTAIVLGILALLISMVGAKCTNCLFMFGCYFAQLCPSNKPYIYKPNHTSTISPL
uniref:Claudin 4 n=1 Tax=Astyanax mexicanus TaxID=7994 RepID=A0A8B9JQS0_ASTMX